jgi:hypothetical protein
MKSSTTATDCSSTRLAPRCACSRANGYNLAERFPAIVAGATRLKAQSLIIDGEAVVIGPDGLSLAAPYAPSILAAGIGASVSAAFGDVTARSTTPSVKSPGGSPTPPPRPRGRGEIGPVSRRQFAMRGNLGLARLGPDAFYGRSRAPSILPVLGFT